MVGVMSRFIDLIDKRFSRLLVVSKENNDRHGRSRWLCQCDCGKMRIVRGVSLTSRRTKSCGCLSKEKTIERQTKHGHGKNGAKSSCYESWLHMIQRCHNRNHQAYRLYGNRGIFVCDKWRKFENFLKDMGQPPTDKHQIDRIDNDKGYCPKNSRWSTPKQNSRNKRNNHVIDYQNKRQCLAWWAEELNINKSTLANRLDRGWSIEKALTTPVRKKVSRI